MYYLKTRYYDPKIGRFITIDDISYLAPDTINGLNLYAYCRNNPVLYYDPIGCNPIAPFFGIEMDAIEMPESGDSDSQPPLQEYDHPAS